MKRLVFLFILLANPVMGQGTPVVVPSGQPVTRIEILWEDHPEFEENWLVLRFLAPEIARGAGKYSYAEVASDMDVLCRKVGLKAALSFGGDIDVIVVSLVDQPLARGVTNPNVTQFNSSYRLVKEDCIWE